MLASASQAQKANALLTFRSADLGTANAALVDFQRSGVALLKQRVEWLREHTGVYVLLAAIYCRSEHAENVRPVIAAEGSLRQVRSRGIWRGAVWGCVEVGVRVVDG